ncbi:MAG: ketoacyl-ACP synthase III [Anaerolineae bacterium]|nr:ketoacyl-ACP synthase III [Anaerolineae bacterium]
MRYAHIIGWGKYAPERVLTNADLEKMVETTDEWIRSRTGIRERHVAANPKDTTATLAVRAARDALNMAGVHPAQIDLIIVSTSSPEHIFPATACLVQDALGASKAGAFDLSAACSGFVYALSMAHASIASGNADYVLVLGSETLSRITDWKDRNTCVLFGDGAGALLLRASEQPGGVLSTVLGSDGSGGDLLILPAGGSRFPTTPETLSQGMHYIKMDGREVFRFATRVMAKATQEVIAKAGLRLDDVNLVIPHQANERIINSSMSALKLPPDKVFVNLDRYGNTSTASIPIALCEAVETGRVRPNDTLVFVGFGAGLTWAAAAVKWGVPPPPPKPPSWWRRFRLATQSPWATLRSWALRWGRRIYALIPGYSGESPYLPIGRTKETPPPVAPRPSPPPEEPPADGAGAPS